MDRSTLVTSLLFILTIYCGDFSKAQILNPNEKIKWVPFKEFNPQNHEVAGWEMPNTPIFIARMQDGAGQALGKYQVSQNAVHILREGRQLDIGQSGEILQYPRGAMSWAPMRDVNQPPHNLFLAGFDPKTDEPLYVCRGIDDNRGKRRVSPGSFRFSRAQDGCEINHLGVGTWVQDFEILALSFFGIVRLSAA